MADEDTEYGEEQKKKGCLGKIIKLVLFFIVLLGLLIGGFFLGAYLKLFNPTEISNKYKLHEYPIIGKYLPRDTTQDEENKEENVEENIDETNKKINQKTETKEQDKINTEITAGKKIVLTKKEIEAQTKKRQAEEKKRVNKLANMYSEMKPEEAAEIFDKLDDEIAIQILSHMEENKTAKIMAKLDSVKAAHFTKMMYQGINTISLAHDITN